MSGSLRPPEAYFATSLRNENTPPRVGEEIIEEQGENEESPLDEYSVLAAPIQPPPTEPQRSQQIRRFQQSSNLVRDRVQASNNGFGPFGVPAHWQPTPLPALPARGGSSGFCTSRFGSKIPSSLLVVAVVLFLLYLLTPSFVTLPAASPLDMPQVSHFHVLLLALASGLLTFALQFVM